MEPGSGRTRRGSALRLWLALALAASVVLAVQSVQSWRSHRRTAEGVLTDYARLAAGEARARLESRFAVYTCGAVARASFALEKLAADDPLPTAPELAAGVPEALRPSYAHLREVLGWDFATGRFRGGAPPDADSLAARVRLAADTHADDERGWIYAPTDGRIVRIVREADGRPVRAWILGLDREGAAARVDAAVAYAPLLPTFLLRGTDPDAWSRWTVRTPSGETLAAAGAETPADDDAAPSPWTAEDTTAAFLGSLAVEVRILPTAAALLVPGGVPRSNAALTLALVALSAVLLIGADRQVRREAELTRLREDFLAGISHELRTPLAQIRMFADTLRLGRVRSEEEEKRSLEIVGREAKRLSHLVENVLVDSRSVRGVLRAAPVHVDLSRRLTDLAAELEPLAEAGGARVAWHITPGIAIVADPELLHQAVANLVENAVKFGPRGQTVTIGAERTGDDVRVWVEDQGPGIPAADRERVVERFFRLERDRDGAVAGTGIGLSVVGDVVRLHGGRLEITDAEGGGARFTLRLRGGEEA